MPNKKTAKRLPMPKCCLLVEEIYRYLLDREPARGYVVQKCHGCQGHLVYVYDPQGSGGVLYIATVGLRGEAVKLARCVRCLMEGMGTFGFEAVAGWCDRPRPARSVGYLKPWRGLVGYLFAPGVQSGL